MKILSYNINGLNAFNNSRKLESLMHDYGDADIICFQEVKANPEKIHDILDKYDNYKSYSSVNTIKKGYAGVTTLIKKDLLNRIVKVTTMHFNENQNYLEGRVVIAEFDTFVLVNVYVPNSGNKEDIRKQFDDLFVKRMRYIDKQLIICGDLNVCSTELDYWGNYTKAIDSAPGLMQFEIDGFNNMCDKLLLTDAYRHQTNERKYSWFSTRNKNAVENRKGWRLDYFLVDNRIVNECESAIIEGYQTPDHSPIILYINI